ncbi:MAG: hypothetical protein IJA35_03925 [Clostridia bacterium]|nr:hypothetical protein [Clostridia bacterium]
MEERRKNKAIKIVIVVLAVLLCVNSIALAVVFLYDRFVVPEPTSVVAPDNIITPDDDALNAESDQHYSLLTRGSEPYIILRASSKLSSVAYADDKETTISLSPRNPSDNVPFNVLNMFPGDVETKYYKVEVSYKDTVTVKYRAEVRDGYEKLAEVLKCKITLLSSDEVLYEGLMRDMPESLDHVLTSEQSTEQELLYEITAYLDTSVGNEYQRQELFADFHWWIETEEGPRPPISGDNAYLPLAIGMVMVSALAVFVFRLKRRKEAVHECQ